MHTAQAQQAAEGPGLQWIFIAAFFVLLIVAVWLVMRLRARAQNRYKRQYTQYDMLTGLPNWEKMKAKIEKSTSGALAVFEIKFFKAYNELMGYEVGDKVLKGIANRLCAAQTEYNLFAARLQSASFAVLLPAMDKEALKKVMQRLLEQIGKQDEEARWNIRFACGVAYLQPGAQVTQVLENANFARLAAKDSIGTEIVFFDDETHRQFTQVITSAGHVRQGVGTGDLVVAYQPKYALQTGRLIGAEALIRWQHPQRGLLLPAEFLPTLEQTGNIKRVDFYVLRQVLWQLSTWHEKNVPILPIAVNISRTQFSDNRFADILLEITGGYAVHPSYIQLDLTEGAFSYDEEQALELLQKLKQAGFALALDDFGAGVSSVNNLRKLPLDVLNFDRSVLEDIDTNQRQQLFLQDMVQLSHDMGISTMVKGVETQAQADFAYGVGCDIVEGFLYGRPMPAEEYQKLLLQGTGAR